MEPPRPPEWFDNDTFWKDAYPFLFTNRAFAEAPELAGKVVGLADLKSGSVLDLACGPGRVSIALARQGFSVTGVDRTRHFLDKAREAAADAGVAVEWVHADMREFVRPSAFDLVLSVFTSFGYFDNKEEDLEVLRNMLVSLRPGGAVVVDLMGKELLAGRFLNAEVTHGPDGTRLVKEHRIFDDWTRIQNEWTLIREGRATTFSFHHTIYSGWELRSLLESAGFSEVTLYGSLDGAPYDRRAVRLIAVGRRASD